MKVNDPAHLTDELPERLLASDDIEKKPLLRLAGVSELYCRQRRSGGRRRLWTNGRPCTP